MSRTHHCRHFFRAGNQQLVAVQKRYGNAVYGENDFLVPLINCPDKNFPVLFKNIRTGGETERTDRRENDAVGAGFDDRTARCHGIRRGTGRRGNDHAVARKRRDLTPVAERFQPDHTDGCPDDRFVERTAAVDELSAAKELQIKHHAGLDGVVSVGDRKNAVGLCLLQLGKKALVSEIDAKNRNPRSGKIAGELQNRTVTAEGNNEPRSGQGVRDAFRRNVRRPRIFQPIAQKWGDTHLMPPLPKRR